MTVPSREQACVLAIVAAAYRADPDFWEWHRIADVIQETESAERDSSAASGQGSNRRMPRGSEVLRLLAVRLRQLTSTPTSSLRFIFEGHEVVTVLDKSYPATFRAIFNRPPFLFVAGEVLKADKTSLAIVGTRSASKDGIRIARSLATQLAERGVTVVSGLAHGIDQAAHEAALEAGGRTIAVMGTGIRTTYPAANKVLRSRIVRQGAAGFTVLAGHAGPTQFNFLMRNVVTSGMSLGTVVIEAGDTSGAAESG